VISDFLPHTGTAQTALIDPSQSPSMGQM
jgi:hypothetical protein